MLEVNPFERMNWLAHGCSEDSIAYWVVFKHEMWWFQIRTQVIAKYVPSLLEYLSMQAGFWPVWIQARYKKDSPSRSDQILDRPERYGFAICLLLPRPLRRLR
jgi:hypothetical protein